MHHFSPPRPAGLPALCVPLYTRSCFVCPNRALLLAACTCTYLEFLSFSRSRNAHPPPRTAIPSPNDTVVPCPPYPSIHSVLDITHTRTPPSPCPLYPLRPHLRSLHRLSSPHDSTLRRGLFISTPLIVLLFRSLSHLHNPPDSVRSYRGTEAQSQSRMGNQEPCSAPFRS